MNARTTPHDESAACGSDHCHSCHVDEPIGPDETAYEICGECGHVYRTARDLRRAYRRMVLSLPGAPRWRRLWQAMCVRASRVYFCQECSHDF